MAGGPDSRRRQLTDHEILLGFDEFLYHGELRDFVKAQHSFERISSSLGTEDFDALVPPCLEVLEFSNQFIRNDTLLCLMHISMGCTLCDIPCEALVPAMRRHAAILARHDAMPMLVRSLDFLLGHEPEHTPAEHGMLEREFRLIFNCIYLQVIFCKHDEGFVQGLELGQGRLGASLVSLLFEAAKMCAENDRIPIKKVVLLLLLVLQCLLDVPDQVLCPALGPEPSSPEAPARHPQLHDFQAFTALHLHERSVRQKYSSCGCPAAIKEGLGIIRRHIDEFLISYAFHPSELSFMQSSGWLQDAYRRYEELRQHGLVAPRRRRSSAEALPRLLQAGNVNGQATAAVVALGSLAPAERGGATAARGRHADASSSSSGLGSDSEGLSSAASDVGSDASSACTVIMANTNGTDPKAGPAGGGGSERSAAAGAAEVAQKDPFVVQVAEESSTGMCPEGPVAGRPSIGRVAAVGTKDRSPVAVFQRLYLAIFPRLTETVVLLLRLLLTSCSNVENYPGVVDMARERHATGLTEEIGGPEYQQQPSSLPPLPSEPAEAQRHREIMAAGVSGVILVLLKQARKSVPEQFSSLAQLITDSNGALVVLKFLNQDLSSAMEPRDAPPVLPCLREGQQAGGSRAGAGPPLPSWPACATLRLVEVLYLLCKDSPERVRKYLIHYKAPFILKRLRHIENWQVQRVVLKLLRKQVRYLPRKWKQANMKAISAIYSLVPMSPLEDWLLNEPLGDATTEGPTQADVRTSNVAYNASLLRHLSSAGAAAVVPGGAVSDAQAPGCFEPPAGSLVQQQPHLADDGAVWPTSARDGVDLPALGMRQPIERPILAHNLPAAHRATELAARAVGLASACVLALQALPNTVGTPGGYSGQDGWQAGAPPRKGGSGEEDLLGGSLGYARLFPEHVPACCR